MICPNVAQIFRKWEKNVYLFITDIMWKLGFHPTSYTLLGIHVIPGPIYYLSQGMFGF